MRPPFDDMTALDPEAVVLYLSGDLLGCARRLANSLPRTDVHTLLLLLTVLRNLGADGLVDQLAERFDERLRPFGEQDPELWASLRVLLDSQPASPQAASERVAETPRLAFWMSRRLDPQAPPEALHDLLAAVAQHPRRSFEGFMAAALLQATDEPGVDGPADVSEHELVLLGAGVLQRLGEMDLLAALADELATSERADLRFAGMVARARVLCDQDRWPEAFRVVLDTEDAGVHGDPESVEHAVFMVLMAPVSHGSESVVLVERLLERLASFPAHPSRWAVAVLLALALEDRPALAVFGEAVTTYIVATDALVGVGDDLQALNAIVKLLLRDDGVGADYVDDACDRTPEVDRFAGAYAAIMVYRRSGSDGLDGAPLERAAARALADDALAERSPKHLALLAMALIEAGLAHRGGELGYAAMAARGFVVGDEETLELVGAATQAFAVADTAVPARRLLVECIEHTPVELHEPHAIHDGLVTALMRSAASHGAFEDVLPGLYEQRYRLDRVPNADRSGVPAILTRLGQAFEFQASFGAAQRYYQEVLLRADLQPLTEHAERYVTACLRRVRIRIDGASDDEYSEFVEEAFGVVADSRSESTSSSYRDTYSDLTMQRVRHHLAGDAEGLAQVLRQVRRHVGTDPSRSLYLAMSTALQSGLFLVSRDEHEEACDVLLEAADRMITVLALLAAVSPVEDLRESCLHAAQLGEIVLSLAPSVDADRAQRCYRAFVRLRSLWGDLRMLRADVGGDARSAQRAAIARARRRIGRLLLDGPERDAAGEFYEALMDGRLQRDLDEIAGMWRRVPGADLETSLHRAFEASDATLGPNGAFVGYFRFGRFLKNVPSLSGALRMDGEDSYVAVIARAGGWTTIPLGTAASIDELAQALPGALRADALSLGTRGGVKPLDRIVELLVAPVLAYLGEEARVHVTGEGKLADLPWSLLFERAGLAPEDVSSVQSFCRIGRERVGTVRLGPGAVVIGRPAYGHRRDAGDRPGPTGFDDLVTTDVEAVLVAEACGAVATTGARATAEAVLGASPTGVLHIASHGYTLYPEAGSETYELESDKLGAEVFIAREDLIPSPLAAERLRDPLLHCGLAMAGINDWLAEDGRGAPDTGIVTGEDLSWCDLADVDCVVLSACSSGAGGGSRTMGSRGMRFASLVAGADWIVASLWPVPDVATAVLVEMLYAGFAQGLAPPQALAEAQRRLRALDVRSLVATKTARGLRVDRSRDMAGRYLDALEALGDEDYRPFAHPYYWSGFMCSG